jgi:hypothetical protein
MISFHSFVSVVLSAGYKVFCTVFDTVNIPKSQATPLDSQHTIRTAANLDGLVVAQLARERRARNKRELNLVPAQRAVNDELSSDRMR